jgi:hypothetical protein
MLSKKMIVWSSLGSVAAGAVVALARRKGKRGPDARFLCEKIPPRCQRVYVWTEPYTMHGSAGDLLVRSQYILLATPFLVWSVLDLPLSTGVRKAEGGAVYHITHQKSVDARGVDAAETESSEPERYYGTLGALLPGEKAAAKNALSRGAVLEIRKCYVGGSSNGVETGEVCQSPAPVLNYRFEYGPGPD